jgi:RNA polymerase sigma factor (sigma-70 family)
MITFHEIYERHSKDVYRYSYWLSGSAEDADDITSDTFARAWVGCEEIRTETVKAYLFAIARNLYLKGLRHSKRQADLNPNQKETEMKSYKKGRKLMIQHNVLLGLAVFTTFLSFPAFVSLRDEDPLAPFYIAGIAVIFWVAFFFVNRRIDD